MSFGLALALVSVVNGVLVVAKEKNARVMTMLQKMTWHHWISHALIVLLLFIACGGAFALANNRRVSTLPANRLIKILLGGVLTGGLLIIGFYLIDD